MVWTTIDSIASGVYRRVVPLYWVDRRDRAYVVGSAVPFENGGWRCLLTAAHVCFEHMPEAQPLFTMGDRRPWALTRIRGVWQYEPGRTPDIDISVIVLDEECGDDLANYYQFSTSRDLSMLLPKTDNTYYMIAGYPASRNRSRHKNSVSSLATFFVLSDLHPLGDLISTDKSAEFHFALSVPLKHGRVGGGTFHLPDLHGMSGGGIWRFEIDEKTRLVTTPSLVGIGIEYHKVERAIVGTHIQVAVPLVSDLISQSHSERPPLHVEAKDRD